MQRTRRFGVAGLFFAIARSGLLERHKLDLFTLERLETGNALDAVARTANAMTTNDQIAFALVAAFLAVIAWWIQIQEKYTQP